MVSTQSENVRFVQSRNAFESEPMAAARAQHCWFLRQLGWGGEENLFGRIPALVHRTRDTGALTQPSLPRVPMVQPTHAGQRDYANKRQRAVDALVQQGFVLPEDATALASGTLPTAAPDKP